MSARNSDDGRIREMYRVMKETAKRIQDLGITQSSFCSDESVRGRMYADGIFMCVFRVSEEAGNMSEETRSSYPEVPWRAIRGMRNIFAHDYGKLDRALVWSAVADDFPKLLSFCEQYAADRGISLHDS